MTWQELEEKALSLPITDRGKLASSLLESLEPAEAEIPELWIREAERRAEEMRTGKVQGEPVADVITRIRDRPLLHK